VCIRNFLNLGFEGSRTFISVSLNPFNSLSTSIRCNPWNRVSLYEVLATSLYWPRHIRTGGQLFPSPFHFLTDRVLLVRLLYLSWLRRRWSGNLELDYCPGEIWTTDFSFDSSAIHHLPYIPWLLHGQLQGLVFFLLHILWGVVAHWKIRRLERRRVASSNPALRRHLKKVLHSQLPVALCRETPTQYPCCRERLWVVVDLKRRYRNNLNKLISCSQNLLLFT